ncbi:MAG: replicative DNA helicase [Bdellovibrionales bacterium]|nr:replicative DNA helicase [Bdellovibrionales bacterium]
MAEFSGQKLPPQNVEAEQSVLGAMLLDNEASFEVMEILHAEDFYRPQHQKIFSSIVSLVQKDEPADLVTLTNELKTIGELEKIGGVSYLAQLVESVPTSANVLYYAKIVRDKAVYRNVIHAASQIQSSGYEGTGDIDNFLDEAEQIIFKVSENRQKGALTPISSVVKESFRQIEKNYERKELITGLASGFNDLDKLTSGLQPSDLIIIAGRPSMGKTSFCLNIAQHVAIQEQETVALFSLEMSREQLVTRLLCSEAKVDSSKLRSGFISEEEWMKLTDSAGRLSESQIYIDDTPQASVFDMRAKARRLKASKGLGLIIVDYLQLMSGKGRIESREREISEISRSLKGLAKELNVPVIALSQLNRGVESRQDKRPMLSDLRESGAIEQDADIVGFIYRDEVYNKDTPDVGIAEFNVVKHRNGPIGMVRLSFQHAYTRFGNLSTEYSDAA